jgi:hypothetical protein
MEQYVTLFDSFFLPQGITLYESLEKHADIFTLWVICIDNKSFEVLTKLKLNNLRLIKLSEVETPELLLAKHNRSHKEYCWTLTSFSFKFVFDANPEITRVTYLDADLWFRKSPSPIFKEFEKSGKQVLITEHAYTAELDQSELTGRYCVQFMTFNRVEGEYIRKWWADKCIEWCYARFENGKFGDQKYLDDWDVRFEKDVHILNNPEWSLAPWNASRFPYSNSIFYHFHGLRLLKNGNLIIDGYPLPKPVIKYIYKPYVIAFRQNIQKLIQFGYTPVAQDKKPGLLRSIKRIYVGITNQIWRFKIRKTIR